MQAEEGPVEAYADRILASGAAREPLSPFTDTDPAFDLALAYDVSARVTRRRIAGGERTVGWKIGFTNQAIWAEQGLSAPIWAPMYATTVAALDPTVEATVSIGNLMEPRIEPEIGLRLARVPQPDMDDRQIIACVDAVTHGFEIVQSLYPGWRLKPADAVAAFGMHGSYRHGPLVAIAPSERERWLQMLRDFTVVIFRDGLEMERGVGTNVLGGAISSLRHLVRGVGRYQGYALNPGDLVTTGTLTRALPIAPGERWSTAMEGIPLKGLALTLRE